MTACVIKTLSVQIIHHCIKPRRVFLVSVCNFLLLCINVCVSGWGILKNRKGKREGEQVLW